jgi:hypothetical protein
MTKVTFVSAVLIAAAAFTTGSFPDEQHVSIAHADQGCGDPNGILGVHRPTVLWGD